jgi:hypothetical protein
MSRDAHCSVLSLESKPKTVKNCIFGLIIPSLAMFHTGGWILDPSTCPRSFSRQIFVNIVRTEKQGLDGVGAGHTRTLLLLGT